MKTVSSYLILLFVFFSFGQTALAGDQSKSTDFFVGDSEAEVSSATDMPFSFYIGDNLTGVTDPVKSVYFTVSGVFIGGGTLDLRLNNDATTAKTFAMPNVTTPTAFEIIYKDDSNKINPQSAGSYNYTLNLNPAGVTISGLGVKAEVTYQFAPTSCHDGVPTNEKIKTTDGFVGDSEAEVSSATDMPFSFYIGDNLTGVTDPVKSVYFTVSGVFIGGGTLDLRLNNDATTAKTFAMPNVTTPTAFEIIYKDDSNKINPQSAGSYNYTLNLNPAGVTISGLGVKVTESHRYKPPTCGAGFKPFGDLISQTFETTGSVDGPAYNSILWKGELGGVSKDQGKIKLQLAASNCINGANDYPTCSGGANQWVYVGGATCISGDWYESTPDTPMEINCFSQLNNKRYFKYKTRLCSDDCSLSGSYTPQVDDVVVSWSP